MEHNTPLASKIGLIEEEMEAKYRAEFQARENRLDFSNREWTEEMKQIVTDYRKAIDPELQYIRKIILETLQESNFTNVGEVGVLIQSTQQLKNHIAPDVTDYDSLLFALALVVMQDLKPDARDAMLYLAELVKLSKAKKLDIRAALEKLLPYTSTDVQFGEYSMRVLFQQTIEQSTPIRKQKKQ